MNGLKLIVAFACVISMTILRHSAQAQIPEGWEIVEITNTPILFDGHPDINDRGQIVFTGSVGSSFADREIFVYDRGRFYRITEDDLYDEQPSLNNYGEIVWARDSRDDGALSIVKWQNGTRQTISDQPFYESGVNMNDVGDIVWLGLLDGTASTSEVFLFDGVSIIQISNDGFSNQGPRINNNGQIIWTRCDFSGNESAIILYDHGNIRPLSEAETDCNLANMNDVLQVVWTDSQFRLQRWEDGIISQITTNIAGSPRINGNGTVVFTRWDAIQQIHSIWMFDEKGVKRVTDAPTSRSTHGVNNRGEIVFTWGPFLRDVGVITNPIFKADADFDGDVDLRDFAVLQNCWNTATFFGSACSEADINVNDLVEPQDIQILVDLLTGPNDQP